MAAAILWLSFFSYYHHHEKHRPEHCTECCSLNQNEHSTDFAEVAYTKLAEEAHKHECAVCSFLKIYKTQSNLLSLNNFELISKFSLQIFRLFASIFEDIFFSKAREPPFQV